MVVLAADGFIPVCGVNVSAVIREKMRPEPRATPPSLLSYPSSVSVTEAGVCLCCYPPPAAQSTPEKLRLMGTLLSVLFEAQS